MTETAVPRKQPQAASPQLGSLYRALSDLQDSLRSQPVVEFKDFELVAGDYPILITTKLRGKIRGVRIDGVWFASSDPSAATYAGDVHWQLGDRVGEIKINGIQDLTATTRYRVSLRIEGDR